MYRKIVLGLSFVAGALSCASAAQFPGYAALGEGAWQATNLIAGLRARPYGAGFTWQEGEIACRVTNAAVNAGAAWGVKLDQKEATPVSFTVEGRALSVVSGAGFRIYVDIDYCDGSHEFGRIVTFRGDPAARWQKRTVELIGKRIKLANFYVMLSQSVGEVRFRKPELRLGTGGAAARLDGVSIVDAAPPQEAVMLVRDAAAKGGFVPFDAAGRAAGVTFAETVERRGGVTYHAVKVSGDVPRDRALTLVFARPLGPGRVAWCKDPRTTVAMTAESDEGNVAVAVPYGRGLLSKWPFVAATVGGRGLGLSIDPRAPAVYRAAVNPRLGLMTLAFDIALAPEKNTAEFSFAAFDFPAAENFRGALAAWMKAYPFATQNRMTKWGLWTVSVPPYKIERFEDFGFAYMEGDEGQWKWYDANGIYCFHYTEPSSWWMRLPGKDGGLPTMAECVAHVEELAKKGDVRALSWKQCIARDEYGEPVGHIQSQAWCPKGTMWSLNSAPGLKGAHTDYNVKLSEESFKRRYGATAFPQGPDGEYVDSTEMGFSMGGDYDRAHLSAMVTPLCWGGEKMKPCVSGAMLSFEYARSVYDRLKAYGRYTLGNSTPHRTSLIVPFLDIPGTEVDWHRNNTWRPAAHEDLIYKRAVAGKKPYCFLFNTNYRNLTHATVEKYMQRTLAYGMFPGFFSDNGYTDCYFSFPEYYNRDRDLFKKYVPLTCEIAAAGWEPVTTLAKTKDPEVFIEQFGTRYVTIFNSSTTAQKEVVVESARPAAFERIRGVTWRFDGGACRVTLPPETVRLLDFAE